MCILLTVAAKNNWPIYKFEFVAVYLNVPIDKNVLIQPLFAHFSSNCRSSPQNPLTTTTNFLPAFYLPFSIKTPQQQLEKQVKVFLEIKWKKGLMGVVIHQMVIVFELTQPNLMEKIIREFWDRKTSHHTPLPEGLNISFIVVETGVQCTENLSLIGSLN